MANNNFREIGRLGQKRYGGFFYEEFLKDLQGRKGVEVYREMSENDDVIGAFLGYLRGIETVQNTFQRAGCL